MSRVSEIFGICEHIGNQLESIYRASGKEYQDTGRDVEFNPQRRAIEEYREYNEKIKDQLNYICENVDEYNRVWNGTMRDYYFALSKFIQKIPAKKNQSVEVAKALGS